MSYNPYRKYHRLWWTFWLSVPGDAVSFFKRVWDYAPILWHDHDWDYTFLLKLMRFKLERMYPAIKYGMGADCEERAIEIQQAIVMLQNIEDDPQDEFHLHWGQWHRNKDLNDPCPAGKRVCSKALADSANRELRNWRKLWRHLDKHLQGWWE